MRQIILVTLIALAGCRTVELSPDRDPPHRVEEKKAFDPMDGVLSAEERRLFREADLIRVHELGEPRPVGDTVDEFPIVRTATITAPRERDALRRHLETGLAARRGEAPGGTFAFQHDPGHLAIEARRGGENAVVLVLDLTFGYVSPAAGSALRVADHEQLEAIDRLAFGPHRYELYDTKGKDAEWTWLRHVRARDQSTYALRERGPEAREALPEVREVLRGEPDHYPWVNLLGYLQALGAEAAPAVPELVALLERDWSAEVRPARRPVIVSGPPGTVPLGEAELPARMTEFERDDLRIGALRALARIGPAARDARPLLEKLAASDEGAIVDEAREALAAIDQ